MSDDQIVKVDNNSNLSEIVFKNEDVYKQWVRSMKIDDVERRVREDITSRKMGVKDQKINLMMVKRLREVQAIAMLLPEIKGSFTIEDLRLKAALSRSTGKRNGILDLKDAYASRGFVMQG